MKINIMDIFTVGIGQSQNPRPSTTFIRTSSHILLFLFTSVGWAQSPVMQWTFEEIHDGKIVEPSTGNSDTVEGHFDQAPGVSGKGLRFDGFTTRIVREGKKLVKPGPEFTFEAWVALGEYPLNWCPVITTENDEVKGYRLLIGPYGQVSFEAAIGEQWIACSSGRRRCPCESGCIWQGSTPPGSN